MRVRPAAIDADEPLFVDMVRQHLNPGVDSARYQWLYRACPLGQPRAWVAEDAKGTPAGIAAAFPRRVYLRGELKPAWVLGDFCVTVAHRSLGPAVRLQRACLDAVSEAGCVIYDFPGLAMLPVYRRLRLRPSWSLRRFVKPLSLHGRLHRSIPRPIARCLARVAELVLARLEAHGAPADLDVHVQTQPCGPEFSRLAAAVGTAHGFCVDRSADYLTWRYLQAPHHFQMLAARRGRDLLGYAVVRHRGQLLELVDIFGFPDAPVPSALLRAVLGVARCLGVSAVCATVAEFHPWVPHLRRWGFWPRERHPLILLVAGRTIAPESGTTWFLSEGDRDS